MRKLPFKFCPDVTYCETDCKLKDKCGRHVSHHITGDPGQTLWVARFRRRGMSCQFYIQAKDLQVETRNE